MRISDCQFLDCVSGLSLAAVLVTNYRFSGSVGVGEVGLAVAVAFGLVVALRGRQFFERSIARTMARLVVGYFLLVSLPVTLMSYGLGTTGSSLRDWAAYLFSAVFIFSLVFRPSSTKLVVSCFLFAFLGIVAYQYYAGGENAWYGFRFTAGANNPNQLALYVVCALALTWGYVENQKVRVLFMCLLTGIGLASISDAFFAYLVVVLLVSISAFLVPQHNFARLLAPVVLTVTLLALLYGVSLGEIAATRWSNADESGYRLALYINGLQAWLSNPVTAIIGNGAGSFSGIEGPFGLAEAHNSPIDVLSIGGIVGLTALFCIPVVICIRLYVRNEPFLLALVIGILGFSLFHFVVRHPIYWFTLLALAELTQSRPAKSVA